MTQFKTKEQAALQLALCFALFGMCALYFMFSISHTSIRLLGMVLFKNRPCLIESCIHLYDELSWSQSHTLTLVLISEKASCFFPTELFFSLLARKLFKKFLASKHTIYFKRPNVKVARWALCRIRRTVNWDHHSNCWSRDSRPC